MTALLNDDSAPTHCGIVTYDATALHRLLHVPIGARIDAINRLGDGSIEVLLAGTDIGLPLVQPGYPVPNVQLVAMVDPNGRVTNSAILPIDADIGALNTVMPDEGQAA